MKTALLIIFTVFLFSGSEILSKKQSYYDILGVQKSATNAEIKKSYKKLALKLHPDRNQDSPTAQDDYIALHKAYEIIMDSEKRKIYDKYGEEGLEEAEQQKEHFQPGGSFGGLYDDDDEIIKFTSAYFTISALKSKKFWVVNFHMPNCEACNQAADSYRQLARSLENVVGFATVNCMMSNDLCEKEDVRKLPYIKIYPEGAVYSYSDFNLNKLSNFVLSKLYPRLKLIDHTNIDSVIEHNDGKPWFLAITDYRLDENDFINLRKIALSLKGMINVGYLYCEKIQNNKLCKLLDDSDDTILRIYLTDSISNFDKYQVLDSMHHLTVIENFIQNAEDIEWIDDNKFNELKNKLETDELYETSDDKMSNDATSRIFTILFLDSKSISSTHLERIRMKALFDKIRIYAIDCDKYSSLCKKLGVLVYPRAGLFKKEGYEFHYGLFYSEEIDYFVKISIKSNNIIVNKNSKELQKIYSEPTLIYFFNSYCQPCVRKIWIWRSLYESIANKYNFKLISIDCSVNMEYCQQQNIYSMPSVKAFDKQALDSTSSFDSVVDLIDFIKDLNIKYIEDLTPITYESLVNNKGDDEIWFVDHFASWCSPCMQMMPEFKKSAKKFIDKIKFGKIDCEEYESFCNKLGLNYYPNIRLYPSAKTSNKNNFITFNGWNNAASFNSFLNQYLPSDVFVIRSDNHMQFIEENKENPILIDFYAQWCQPCLMFAHIYEEIATKAKKSLKNLVVAKVECSQNGNFCSKYNVNYYPYLMLLHPQSSKKSKEEISSSNWDADAIIRNVKLRIKSYMNKDEL